MRPLSSPQARRRGSSSVADGGAGAAMNEGITEIISTHHITYVGDPDVPAMLQEIGTIRAELESMPITHPVIGYSRLHKDFAVQHIEGPSEIIINLHTRLINKDIFYGIIVLDEGPIPPQSLEGWSLTFKYESSPPTIGALRSRRTTKQILVHESTFTSGLTSDSIPKIEKNVQP